MSTSSTGRLARAAILALVVLGVAVTSLPMASAEYKCAWELGPVEFRCSGKAGCVPGAGFTPQGVFFVGCAAWD